MRYEHHAEDGVLGWDNPSLTRLPLLEHATVGGAYCLRATPATQPLTTAQCRGACTDLAMLQAQDLLDGVDLRIAVDLRHAGVAHVQQLPPAGRPTRHMYEHFTPPPPSSWQGTVTCMSHLPGLLECSMLMCKMRPLLARDSVSMAGTAEEQDL